MFRIVKFHESIDHMKAHVKTKIDVYRTGQGGEFLCYAKDKALEMAGNLNRREKDLDTVWEIEEVKP